MGGEGCAEPRDPRSRDRTRNVVLIGAGPSAARAVHRDPTRGRAKKTPTPIGPEANELEQVPVPSYQPKRVGGLRAALRVTPSCGLSGVGVF
jgi:hypothetical protein